MDQAKEAGHPVVVVLFLAAEEKVVDGLRVSRLVWMRLWIFLNRQMVSLSGLTVQQDRQYEWLW